MFKGTMALMTGAGIGVDYSALRAKGTKIVKTGGQGQWALRPDADAQRGRSWHSPRW
jgi:hypothetical protein